MLCVFQADKWWAVRSSEHASFIGIETASRPPSLLPLFHGKLNLLGIAPLVCRGVWTAGIFTVSCTSLAVIMMYVLYIQGFCSQVLWSWAGISYLSHKLQWMWSIYICVFIDGRMWSVMELVTLELSSGQWLSWQGKRMREFKLWTQVILGC